MPRRADQGGGRIRRALEGRRGLVMTLAVVAVVAGLMIWGLLTIEPSR